MKMMTIIVASLLVSLAAATAAAEPVELEFQQTETLLFFDVHNRTFLDVDEIEITVYFYNAADELVYRARWTVDIEIASQRHRPFWLSMEDLRRLGVVRAEARLRY